MKIEFDEEELKIGKTRIIQKFILFKCLPLFENPEKLEYRFLETSSILQKVEQVFVAMDQYGGYMSLDWIDKCWDKKGEWNE